ncbi:MAG: hypothetical protein V3S17_05530, partial [candidate division Zixibacteria bacterium]
FIKLALAASILLTIVLNYAAGRTDERVGKMFASTSHAMTELQTLVKELEIEDPIYVARANLSAEDIVQWQSRIDKLIKGDENGI